MALTVAISGNLNINQGDTTVLTAVVTDSNGNTPSGAITYHWTAPRGSFQGATDQASATYHADFTDADDVDVIVTCSVGSAGDPNPTVSTGSLTAMNALGITGQILNMYITETENTTNGSNTILYADGSSDSAIEAGSDDDLSADLNIYRVSWRGNSDGFVLENNGSGNLGDFFRNNTTQSAYVIFSDGTVYEITQSEFASGGTTWTRWNLTDGAIATKFDNLGADDTLLVGVGDAGSIGIGADTGSNTATVRAAASMATLMPPVIASVADQAITVNTPYELDVSITGVDISLDDNTVEVEGLIAGFDYTWNQMDNQVEIRGQTASVFADQVFMIIATNGDGETIRNVNWSVVVGAPVIEPFGPWRVYKGSAFEDNILVSGTPSQIDAEGLWVGLRSEITDDGLRLLGVIPAEGEFTVDEFDVMAMAENEGGMDMEMGTVEILPALSVFLLNLTADALYKILAPDGTLAWTYDIPNVLFDEMVYGDRDIFLFSDSNDDLLRINGEDGTLAWTYNAPTGSYAEAVYGDGDIYLQRTGNFGIIYKIDGSNGTLAWTYDGVNGQYEQHIYADGAVYFFYDTSDNLYKINASNGSEAWSVTTFASAAYEAPVYSGGFVYVFGGGNLYKVAASNGDITWSNTADISNFGTYSGFNNPLAAGDGVYVFDGAAQDLYKINQSDGSEAWTYSPPSGAYKPLIYADGNVFLFNDTADDLYKVNDADGTLERLYEASTGAYRDIVYGDGFIYLFNNTTDDLLKIDASDMSLSGTFEAPTGNYATPLYSTEERAVYLRGDNDLIKVDATDMTEEWTYDGATGTYLNPVLGN